MSEPHDPLSDTAPDEARSGAHVAEAIEIAERGSAAEGAHDGGEDSRAVERAGPDPSEAGSGGAQSVVGARTSDRLAAGEPKPAGPPFDTD